MWPTYRPHQQLTALKPWRAIRPGDVVVVRDPRGHDRWLLKRCVARYGNQLELRGDNPAASTDSRDFGHVPQRDVAYVVVTKSANRQRRDRKTRPRR
jgi:phage repressor protein C with HTH and peptisase S24 domain